MTKYRVDYTSQFKRDYRKLRRMEMEAVDAVIQKLLNGETLDRKFRDHALAGDYKNCRDCHVRPDLVLVYKKDDDVLVLTALRVASHSELF